MDDTPPSSPNLPPLPPLVPLPPLLPNLPEPTIPEWSIFFQTLASQFTAPEKVYKLACNNSVDNFRTKSITIKLEDNTYKASLQYVVIHCDADTTMEFDVPKTFGSLVEVFTEFYTLLWTHTLCLECFRIIPSVNTLCTDCYPMRIMHHYGMAHNFTLFIPTCPICFEQVFLSKLHCGHYVHKTCFIKMNSERWFTYEIEMKCPLCRASIDSQDKYDYFLWYG